MQISVSLRVCGDDLSPQDITAILGINPRVARSKGDVRISSSGRKLVSKFGFWTWKSDDPEQPLTIDEHIDRLHAAFAHAYPLLASLPHADNTWIDLCIVKEDGEGKSDGLDFLLNAKAIRILGETGLPVEFTFY
jgi:hypothetical protein